MDNKNLNDINESTELENKNESSQLELIKAEESLDKWTSIYLDSLEFDEKLNKSWMSFFVDRSRFTWLVILMITIAWILWVRSLPLESMPEIDIWMWYVATVFPWASPENVEDLVTKRIEKEVWKIKWIDTIESMSMNSVSVVLVRFRSDVDTSDAMRDLRDKVDQAKSDLPDETEEPIVKEVSLDDSPIWIFSISWDYNGFELYDYAKEIKDELEKNPLVSEVHISWGEEKEFWVLIDPIKLEQYWLTLDAVNTAIKAVNITVPVWNIEVWDYTHTISVDSRFYDVETLKNIVVKKLWDTWVVYLKDVAKVDEIPKKIKTISRISIWWEEPLSAVTLSVVKKQWGSIVNLVKEWQEAIEKMRFSWDIPNDLFVTTVVDNWEEIKNDLNHLVRDGIITIILVFASLSIIIWTREALVAWTAVPLVFLVTFALMSLFWQTLNFLSMFSLILSLWLLVDDAIVIISAMNQYKKTWKFTTREAALLVIRDYKLVLTTTTLTVVFIFGSMLFMTWMVWKFVFSIPFVMCVTLIVSLIVAITINPALAVMLWWRNKKLDTSEYKSEKKWFKEKLIHFFNHWFINMQWFEKLYWNIMHKLFEKKRRMWTLFISVIILFVVALSLPITWILKSDFFPKDDSDTFWIDIEAEPWTKLSVTSEITKEIEEYLYDEKNIKNFSTSIGTLWGSQTRWWSEGESYANISVSLLKEDEWRDETSMEVVARLREKFKVVKNAKITVSDGWSMSAMWADFEIRIAWEDFETLEKMANDIIKIVETIPWAIDIKTSRKPLPFEFNIRFDDTRLALYDITVPQVATYLRNIIDGAEVTKVYKNNDEIVVRTKYDNESINTLDKIKDIQIKNNRWENITMRDIMDTKFDPSVFSISRVDQERVITISASADNTTNWTLIQKEFDQKITSYKIPTWYKFITWWMNEEMNKWVSSLLTSMMFWMMLIIALLILLYNSFWQAFLVMITIPLSLIWVFIWLTLFGEPLSFPWLIWMVALFWIVVRNWIILFDKINQNLDEGIEFKEAIIDAWMSRLEPVLLTSICTVLWMIPLTLSNPMWTSLWLSIICWLTVSTVFTLVVLPSLYYIAFRKRYI